MPVVLDPISYAPGVAEDCTAQSLISPNVGVDHFGGTQQIFIKTQSAVMSAGQAGTIDWVMRNPEGNPVDIAACIAGGDVVKFRMNDGLANDQQAGSGNSVNATVVSAGDGHVRVEMDAADVKLAGIFLGEFALVTTAGAVTFSNRLYVHVQGGLFGDGGDWSGPPTIAEIRLYLRDYQQENELLDTFDFDDSEIALATYMPIQYWNEALPPVGGSFNIRTFPYRYHWMIAICAHLYSMSAEHHRRNRLQYSAGGMQIDDKSKAGEYEQKSAQMMQEFKQFVLARKIAINLSNVYGDIGSPYYSSTGGTR